MILEDELKIIIEQLKEGVNAKQQKLTAVFPLS